MGCKGYVLTIAGCPYRFSTGGLGTITALDPRWDTLNGSVDLDYYLDWPDADLTERCKPLDGDLEVDPFVAKLFDTPLEDGTGVRPFTATATRSPLNLTSSPLTADMTATATAFDVVNGALFDPFPRVVWIEREAILCASRSVNHLIVDTRGYLGTVAAAHTRVPDEGRAPEAFADFPWIFRREMILWAVWDDPGDPTNSFATPAWVGLCKGVPRLAEDKLRYELPGVGLWEALREVTATQSPPVAEIVGYGSNSPTIGLLAVQFDTGASAAVLTLAGSATTYPTLDSLLSDWRTRAEAALSYTVSDVRAHASAGGERIQFDAEWTSGNSPHGGPVAAWRNREGHAVTGTAVNRTGSTWSAIVVLDQPAVLYTFAPYAGSGDFSLSSLATLPTSLFGGTTTTGNGRTTRVNTILRVAHSDDYWWQFNNPSTIAALSVLRATVQLVRRKAGAPEPPTEFWVLRDPPPAQVVTQIHCDHWIEGVRFGIVPYLADCTADAWTWTRAEAAIRATTGTAARRTWVLDGQQRLGELVSEACKMSACTPALRDGRLTVVAWTLPTATETPVVVLGTDDVVGLTWEWWSEGIANRIQVDSDALKMSVVDGRSVNRYGDGRTLTVKLLGVDPDDAARLSPADLQRDLLARLAILGEPIACVHVQLPPSVWCSESEPQLGDLVELSEWGLLPDGTGARGMSGVRGRVVARKLPFTTGDEQTFDLELLVFGRVAHGYAACVRVAGVALPAADTVKIALTPVQGADDYAGSVAAGIGNGGLDPFDAGAQVQLVQRHSVTARTQTLEVLSAFDAGINDWRVQFTTAVDATIAALIGAGAVFDLRTAPYATPVTATQALEAFVGDDATGVIGGTADPNQILAP